MRRTAAPMVLAGKVWNLTMIIDSHCHLDKLYTSHYPNGFAGLIAAARASDVSLEGCFANPTGCTNE